MQRNAMCEELLYVYETLNVLYIFERLFSGRILFMFVCAWDFDECKHRESLAVFHLSLVFNPYDRSSLSIFLFFVHICISDHCMHQVVNLFRCNEKSV